MSPDADGVDGPIGSITGSQHIFYAELLACSDRVYREPLACFAVVLPM
jgi:hypothetical protein